MRVDLQRRRNRCAVARQPLQPHRCDHTRAGERAPSSVGARQTGLGGFVAQCALVPVLARTHGRRGALVGACVVAPMWLKRVAGNRPPREPSLRLYAYRLLFDRDPDEASEV